MVSAESSSTGWPDEDEFSVPELGATFSPFDLKVPDGEDVLDRILSVITGPDEGVYVIDACGAASGFTIKQPGATSPSVYKGSVQIISFQGLYLPMEKGAPIMGRLKLLGGCVDKLPNKVTIEGEVSGKLIAFVGVNVAVGIFKVDFEKLQLLDRNRVLEAAPPILERAFVYPEKKPFRNQTYVPYIGGPPPPSLSERSTVKEVGPPSRPRSMWRSMWGNGDVRRFLNYHLIPPYISRHPPPPPPLTTEERIEQLEDKIQRLEQDKVVMQEEFQQLKRQTTDRSFMQRCNNS